MIGNSNQNGIPFIRNNIGIPKAIKESMILWYDVAKQGATNESLSANPVLTDFSGNGRDMMLNGFAFSGMSGVGGYNRTNTQFSVYSNAQYNRQRNTIINITNVIPINNDLLITWNDQYGASPVPAGEEFTLPPIRFKVTGSNNELQFKVRGAQNAINTVIEDGKEYLFGGGTFISNGRNCGFEIEWINADKTQRDVNITFELLPIYPNALVTDGVDDYGISPSFQLGLDWSVVFDVDWLDTENNNSGIVKSSQLHIYSCGADNQLSVFVNNISSGTLVRKNLIAVTSDQKYYLKDGSITTSSNSITATANIAPLYLGKYSTYSNKMAFRKLILFNRVLDTYEVKWVIENLIKTNINFIDTLAYGIEWEYNSNVITRIGNLELHKTLPIQNKLKGVLHDGKNILHYLNPDGWALEMDDGTIPVLDGSDGDVGVAMKDSFYYKIYKLSDRYQVYISEYKLGKDWVEITPCIYSASKTMTRINADGKEEAFNACIKADDTRYIGGNRNNTATYADKLYGKPRTAINISKAIEVCNNRGNGIKVIDYEHYCALQLLYYIEYANFNNQLAVNKNLTAAGYKQGGLGLGITNLNSTKWDNYNGQNPIVETYYQVENNVGNGNYCDNSITLGTDYTGDDTTFNTTPAYFHGIHLFGDIWSFIGDIIIVSDMNNTERSIVYKIKKGVSITEVNINNIKQKCDIIGYQINTNGYIQEFDLSHGLYFIPKTVNTNNKYDYNYMNYKDTQTIRTLLVGSSAASGSTAGVGRFRSSWVVTYSLAHVGFLSITELD